MTAPPSEAVQVMVRLAEAGVRITPNGSNLLYWSPVSLPPELRELLVEHKTSLLAYLSIWSEKRAIALGQEADRVVAELGVPGTDQEIQAAADRYQEALQRHDMATVRAACFAIEGRVRNLAAQKANASQVYPAA